MVVELHHFIDGKKTAGSGGSFADIHDPATGKLTAKVPLGGSADVDAAVAAATRAWPAWAATTPLRRARVLFRFRELVEQHIDELARLITTEHGKVLSDAKGSV